MTELPKDIADLPKMQMGDTALFTFTCTKGHPEQGNVVSFVKRP